MQRGAGAPRASWRPHSFRHLITPSPPPMLPFHAMMLFIFRFSVYASRLMPRRHYFRRCHFSLLLIIFADFRRFHAAMPLRRCYCRFAIDAISPFSSPLLQLSPLLIRRFAYFASMPLA
jgi:hypothetical protein